MATPTLPPAKSSLQIFPSHLPPEAQMSGNRAVQAQQRAMLYLTISGLLTARGIRDNFDRSRRRCSAATAAQLGQLAEKSADMYQETLKMDAGLNMLSEHVPDLYMVKPSPTSGCSEFFTRTHRLHPGGGIPGGS